MQEKATNDKRLDANLDASHATPEVVEIVTSTLADKSSRDVDRTMTHFSQELLTYTDVTLGSTFRDWSAQKGIFEQFMAMWGEGTRCYPTRIVGDARGAMVVFVDSPEMFGHEVRIMAPMDFRDGKIIRQVDYWNGRQIGLAAVEQNRLPADQFPDDFGEPLVGEQAHPALRLTASALSQAFSSGDHAGATGLFTTDAVFEDLTLRTAIVGAFAIVVRNLGFMYYGGSDLGEMIATAERITEGDLMHMSGHSA